MHPNPDLQSACRRVPLAGASKIAAAVLVAHMLAALSPPPPPSKPGRKPTPAVQHSNPAPKPGALGAEAGHVKTYDAAIRPVRELPLSAEDAKRVKAAMNAVAKSRMSDARALADDIQFPAAKKLVVWYGLYRGFGYPADYVTFLEENPTWPGRRLMHRRLEEKLVESADDTKLVRRAFKNRQPSTGSGLAALALAARGEGREKEATKLARKAWRELNFSRASEKAFLQHFNKVLTPEDHRWRIDRLLGKYVRWRAHRSARTGPANRMAKLLPKAEQQKLRARIAAYRERSSAGRLFRKLPKEKTKDWGLAFNKVQFLRRKKQYKAALKLLLAAPTDPAKVPNLDGWWKERELAAFNALKQGDAKSAYRVIANPGPLAANAANAQAFLAGWLALRRLKKPKAALGHFRALRKTADGPLSRSRAEYWLGRTFEALGKKKEARSHYKKAASIPDTFDSHLARLKLGASSRTLAVRLPSSPTTQQIKAFNSLDSVQAAVIAGKSGLSRHVIRVFLLKLRRVMKTEAEFAMLAHLSEALGDTQMAVRIGKTAIARGHNLVNYAYPVHAFPAYSPLRKPPEQAMLLGIARQESEFSTFIRSGAGARGLMQVMPITARHVCRDYKIRCNISRLSRDKSYNTKLASAYIGDRMEEFGGSYILAIAGYNAGPGRVRQWIDEFGDPRMSDVDPIDWIQRIPFHETRLYVQKVLSNLQIYRARLASGPIKLRLDKDLTRSRTVKRADRGSRHVRVVDWN